ncbi:hypothetical protein TCSYLVIO_007800, partial [Trypanosoma cruzi]
MSSKHHSDTPRHAKQKYSSPQCTSPHNQIVHAPRTAAAHTRQTNVPRISVIQMLQWEVNKRDERPKPKRVPRLAASQRNAATQMNSVLMPSTSHLLHKSRERLKINALSNKLTVQHNAKPQCLLLPSGAVVVAFTGADAHLLFRTTLNTCNAFFRNASLLPNQKNANTSSARNNVKNRKIHYTDTKADRPRRRQPRLGAEAGASHHTMRSCLVGCVHTALHHGGEAVAPCPAPTHPHGLGVRHRDSCTASLGPHASSKDASVHLAASPAPLRRIIGFRASTQHERLTRLRYMEDVRGAAPLGNHGIVNTLEGGDDYFSAGGCVLDGLRRVRHHMPSTEL